MKTRTGLIAKKIGMSRFFDEAGESTPVTLLHVENCQVLGVRTKEKNGYSAVQLGVGSRKAKQTNKPQRQEYAKIKIEPKAKVAEFRVADDALLEVGAELSINHFVTGQYVDVIGTSIGRGFAGPIKRHNMQGQRASHGALKVHRQMGSTGMRQDPGRVFKGKKMPGQMGNVRRTQQNLKVISIDEANNLIVVNGSIPGFEGGYVLIKDAVKKKLPKEAPYPAALKSAEQPKAANAPEAAAPAPAAEASAAPAEAAPETSAETNKE